MTRFVRYLHRHRNMAMWNVPLSEPCNADHRGRLHPGETKLAVSFKRTEKDGYNLTSMSHELQGCLRFYARHGWTQGETEEWPLLVEANDTR